ncbi:hypothetical protein CYLTODRAFT_425707 [Cylindrobasidium torrendii FP15055 ss-10]|uniref:Uncharacterized protein n=1 Tax=Cylindrobasidium torrendii FP15055 ss-10 TaxID=1314674 RepID=A0A0D7B112_9AGAR|nr:hypothetical protein CYLTODRAFT_425707 [Cylindrobasidium torrendii FP15055 ss-10]
MTSYNKQVYTAFDVNRDGGHPADDSDAVMGMKGILLATSNHNADLSSVRTQETVCLMNVRHMLLDGYRYVCHGHGGRLGFRGGPSRVVLGFRRAASSCTWRRLLLPKSISLRAMCVSCLLVLGCCQLSTRKNSCPTKKKMCAGFVMVAARVLPWLFFDEVTR